MTTKYSTKKIFTIALTTFIFLYLWDSFIFYPFKIFSVFLHEIGHILAANITGGTTNFIQLNTNQGGVAGYFGGNRIITTSASYIGTFICGIALLYSSKSKKFTNLTLLTILLLSLYTLIYAKGIFTYIFCIALAIFIIIAIKKLNAEIKTYLLKFTGFFTVLYALVDIKDDLFFHNGEGLNDAIILSDFTNVPSFVFTLVWSFIVFCLLWIFLMKEIKVPEVVNDEQ